MIRSRGDVVIVLLYTITVLAIGRMSWYWETRPDVRRWFAKVRSRITGWKARP